MSSVANASLNRSLEKREFPRQSATEADHEVRECSTFVTTGRGSTDVRKTAQPTKRPLVPDAERRDSQRLKSCAKVLGIEQIALQKRLPFGHLTVVGLLGGGSRRSGQTRQTLLNDRAVTSLSTVK